jgi:hypothetical protein
MKRPASLRSAVTLFANRLLPEQDLRLLVEQTFSVLTVLLSVAIWGGLKIAADYPSIRALIYISADGWTFIRRPSAWMECGRMRG